MKDMIPIFEPYFIGNEKKYLMECIDSNWISSQGKYIIKFENALSDYHNINHAIATSNCTTALHLSLKSLGIGPGDEVICPDLTFIAPANMISLSGARLVLVDVHPDTLTIDPLLIEKNITKNTKAIIVVHQFGHAAHMDEIMRIASKKNIKIIEDNAESIGAKYNNRMLGTFGDISTFSFFGNKIITTGEGGAVLTNNSEIATRSRVLRDHGMSQKKKYYHVDIGYNYRMTNMQAAIGLAQVENLDNILTKRKKQMDKYYNELSNVSGITLRKYADWCKPVHWLMTITFDDNIDRDNFITYMKKQSIDCRQAINPVHRAKHFIKEYNEADFPVANKFSKQSVHLPSYTSLSDTQIKHICKVIKRFTKNHV